MNEQYLMITIKLRIGIQLNFNKHATRNFGYPLSRLQKSEAHLRDDSENNMPCEYA